MPTHISVDLSDVRRKLGILARTMQRGLIIAVAEWLRLSIRQCFDTQSSPEGVPWKTLSQPYGRMKQGARGRRASRVMSGGQAGPALLIGGHKKLYRSGSLFRNVDRSIAIGDDRVTASSTLIYGPAQNFGATINIPEIRPKKSNGTLRWFGPGGQPIFARRVRAHRVTIPARPFLPTPAFAERESVKVIDETLQDAINQAGAA
jgi:phage gpG-like protein